ncbi:MAG: shikimate kinase [Muriicola sp.]
MIIVLVGYMGSGKSVVGQALASALGLPFMDLDDYIENQLQQSISQLFAEKGEIYFRKIEQEYLQKILQDKAQLVLATGGGTPCYSGNMDLILKHTLSVCYLKVSVAELAVRLSAEKNHRPVISHIDDDALPDYIAKHLFERNPFYLQAKYTIVCDGKSVMEIVEEIKQRLV